MSSTHEHNFPQQIGVKWLEAATTCPSFCSPRSPNRTGFGMGRLKPRPTFSPHSSRYGTSSRRASVARAHVVVLMGHPVSRNANVLNQKRCLIAPSVRVTTRTSSLGPSQPILLIYKCFPNYVGKPFLLF